VQWAVTAIYYAALHCLDAHLLGYGVRCKTHTERRAAFGDPQYNIPQLVRLGYRHLQVWSQAARYDGRTFDPDVVEYTALRHYLRRITDFVHL
jgi:uncharacterized protein (UPF0332 family)